jgi:hypothetical protein
MASLAALDLATRQRDLAWCWYSRNRPGTAADVAADSVARIWWGAFCVDPVTGASIARLSHLLGSDRPVTGGEWLTYAQIRDRYALGSAEAARTRVRRLGWRTMPGNDGRTLVLVPEAADLRPGGAHAVLPVGDRADDDTEDRAVTVTLTGLLTEMTARADRAEQRTDEANGRAEAALALAERTLAQLADATERADRTAALLTATTERAAGAEAARDQARAEAERARETAELLRQRESTWWTQGRWRRVLAAWRGQ